MKSVFILVVAFGTAYGIIDKCVETKNIEATAKAMDPRHIYYNNGTYRMHINKNIFLRGVGLVTFNIINDHLYMTPTYGVCFDYLLDDLIVTTKNKEEYCQDKCVDFCKNTAFTSVGNGIIVTFIIMVVAVIVLCDWLDQIRFH